MPLSKLRLLFAVALALALLTSLLAFAGSNELAAQSRPDALGSISGVVRNTDGDPLPNISVNLFQSFYNSYIRTATTDAQGAYELLSVPPGAYRIRFTDNGRLYTSLFYGNGTTLSDAAAVNVSGNYITGIDMVLDLGSTISVTVEPAIPITNSFLYLYLYAKTATGHWVQFDTNPAPYTNNDLAFYGVPNGSYRLCAQPSYFPDYANWGECYDNVIFNYDMPPDDAADIVISGVTHRTIAFKFGDLSQLQGFVHSTEGKPLPHIFLTVEDANTRNNLTTESDAQGHFLFVRLFDGQYTLRVFDNNHDYISTLYDGVPEIGQAQRLDIDRSSRYSLTIEMQPAGYITGVIRLQGGGFPYSPYVVAYGPKAPGNAWSDIDSCGGNCGTSYNPATGVYTVSGLATGIYRVQASDSGDPLRLVTAFYGGKNLQSAANVKVVAGKTTPKIDVTIGEGAYEGSILGATTANGAPAAGVAVGLFYSTPYGGSPPQSPFVTTNTDSQGLYRFDGLPSGWYTVGFRDPKGDYAMTFYGTSYLTPTQVIITGTMTITGVNAALSPGGAILGKIIRAQGKNPADYHIDVRPANSYVNLPFMSVVSDVKGNFEITSLPPGRYWVGVEMPPGTYVPPFVRFYPNGSDEGSAATIVVEAGGVVSGINIPVDRTPSAYLPTIIGNGPTPAR